jgi:uncharacterized protein (TIGR02996 family)
MSTEQAFLDQLAADPGDDVTRLVYADWLDERGDPRAGFLRAEQELARLAEGDERIDALQSDLSDRMRSLPWDWLAAAGKRWDVWLTDWPRPRKIPLIKHVRELTGCGLLEGKLIVESAPVRALSGCTRGESELARRWLRLCDSADGPIGVSLRPCPEPVANATFHPADCFELEIQAHRPGMESAMRQAMRERFGFDEEFVRRLDLPHTMSTFTERAARSAAAALHDTTLTQVRRLVRGRPRPLLVPIFAGQTGAGPFEVRLSSYPAEQRLHVLDSIRDHGGGDLIAASRQAEAGTPIVLGRGVDGAEAERVRRIFSQWGPVEIRTAER